MNQDSRQKTVLDENLRALGALAREDVEADIALPPLAPGAEERTVSLVLEELNRSRTRRAQSVTVSSSSRPRRSLRTRVFGGAAAGAALMLALSLVVLGRGTKDGTALPEYALLVSGGVVEERAGEPVERVALRSSSSLTLVLRPQTHVDGEVEAHVRLVRGFEEQTLVLSTSRSDEGALRLSGRLPKLDLAPGSAELAVTIARKGDPKASHLLRRQVLILGEERE